MIVWSVALNAVHNQIMRHNLCTEIFNESYINYTVRFNMQNAFLKSNISDDGLTWAFTHISICCNSDASKEVLNEVMGPLLTVDSDVVKLKQQFKTLHIMLKCKFKFIKQILKKKLIEYKNLCKQLTNAKRSLKADINNTYCKDYFFQVYNKMMKKQLWRPLNKIMTKDN